jgi:serine/threonine-protein kinase ATR
MNSNNGVAKLINEALSMTNELLNLCDYHVEENKSSLSMSKHFPKLKQLGRSNLIIPLQESLTATLPPDSTSESTHQPFPLDTPTFQGQFGLFHYFW